MNKKEKVTTPKQLIALISKITKLTSTVKIFNTPIKGDEWLCVMASDTYNHITVNLSSGVMGLDPGIKSARFVDWTVFASMLADVIDGSDYCLYDNKSGNIKQGGTVIPSFGPELESKYSYLNPSEVLKKGKNVKKLSILREELVNLIPFMATEDSRFVFNAVNLCPEGAFATNGHSLAHYPFLTAQESILVPTEAINLLKSLKDTKIDILYNTESNQTQFNTDLVTLNFKLIAGTPPNYSSIRPDTPDFQKLSIDKKTFNNLGKVVKKRRPAIVFEPGGDSYTVTYSDAGDKRIFEKQFEGVTFNNKFKVNYFYFLNALKFCSTLDGLNYECFFSMDSPNNPMIFSSGRADSNAREVIVMPVELSKKK